MPEPKPDKARTGLSGVPMFVAVGAVILWLLFVVVMMNASSADEVRWTRLTFVFSSVQAIAFAAAGSVVRRECSQDRVQKAEAKAEANARDATNGRALAVVNVTDDSRIVDKDAEAVFEKLGPKDARDSDVRRRHADAARRLFPDL